MVKTDNKQPNLTPPRIRKFINSAIFVEKTILPGGNGDMDSKTLVTKRCSCTAMKMCPCHSSQTLLKQAPVKNEVQPAGGDSNKQETVRSWIVKKEQEKRERQQYEKALSNTKQQERQKLLEMERRNFCTWLKRKKEAEEEAKRQREQKVVEDQMVKASEKNKRNQENELCFQLWMKKKEESILEKRIHEQRKLVQSLEERNKKVEENQKAYTEWLKSAKNKPKPVPLNRGLQSLCSSVSIAYINPKPWN